MLARLPVTRLSIAMTLVTFLEQAIGQMRTKKTSAAGDDGNRVEQRNAAMRASN